MQSPLISVVITTKNEAKNIENCLNSIANQTYKNFEIIVIDNFSKDNTVEIARRYTDKIFLIGPERSRQRNFGLITVAKGEYGLYLDSDMILSPKLIESFIKNIRKDCSGYFVKEIILGRTFFNRVRRFERYFYEGTVVDAVRIFPINHFKKVGGFDEKIFEYGSGEDWDLNLKLSSLGKFHLIVNEAKNFQNISYYKKNFPQLFHSIPLELWCNDAVIYHNEIGLKLSDHLKKKIYYAKGFSGYINKWGRNNANIQKQFGLFYRYFTIFLENRKWRIALAHPHWMLSIIFYKFFVGIIYIKSKFK